MNKREKRVFPGELRVERRDNEPPKIVGNAAVFGKRSDDLGGFVETIERGAFKDAIKGDVRALFNHDPNLIIGRTMADPPTLTLEETRDGLAMEVIPPDTQVARDLLVSIERGDVTGQSFSFEVEVDEWKQVENGPDERTLKKLRTVFDVGPVVFPAYPDTDVAVREHRTWKQQIENRGASLGALINDLLDAKVTDTKTKEEVQEDAGTAAGISASTVGQIASGSIECPPLNRLQGLARFFGVSVGSLISAAENDGCDYDDDRSGCGCGGVSANLDLRLKDLDLRERGA